jgi:hypothetical protein
MSYICYSIMDSIATVLYISTDLNRTIKNEWIGSIATVLPLCIYPHKYRGPGHVAGNRKHYLCSASSFSFLHMSYKPTWLDTNHCEEPLRLSPASQQHSPSLKWGEMGTVHLSNTFSTPCHKTLILSRLPQTGEISLLSPIIGSESRCATCVYRPDERISAGDQRSGGRAEVGGAR